MTPLALYVLAASSLVQDPNGHAFRPISDQGAQAIADGCTANPLFQNDTDGRHCAVLLTVMSARESAYRLDAIGDGGLARGPFQSHLPAPKTWREAVDAYIPIVRRSMRACPDYPLAILASGTCTNKAGRAISASRIAEAKRVYALAAWKGNDT